MSKEQQYELLEAEHLAGFHNTYTEGCSECYSEARLITAYKTVTAQRHCAE